MELKEQVVTLRKLTASEGKVIVSKSKDEEGNPVIVTKQLYLAVGDTADNYEEVDEMYVEEENDNIEIKE